MATQNTELLKAVLKEGETLLQAQLTIATSADQRAAVLGGIFSASGSAIVAGLLAAWPAGLDLALMLGGIAAAALFLVAAGVCLRTLLPVPFRVVGFEPNDWAEELANNTPVDQVLDQLIKHNQKGIVDNNAVLSRNAKQFQQGALLGIVAPAVGFAVYGITVAVQAAC